MDHKASQLISMPTSALNLPATFQEPDFIDHMAKNIKLADIFSGVTNYAGINFKQFKEYLNVKERNTQILEFFQTWQKYNRTWSSWKAGGGEEHMLYRNQGNQRYSPYDYEKDDDRDSDSSDEVSSAPDLTRLNGEKSETKEQEVTPVPGPAVALSEGTQQILNATAKLKQATSQPTLHLSIGRRTGSQTLLKQSPMTSPLSSRPTPIDARNPSPEGMIKAVAPWTDDAAPFVAEVENSSPFDARFLLNEDLREIIDFEYLDENGMTNLLPQNMEARKPTLTQQGTPITAASTARMSPFAGLLQAYGITDKSLSHEQINQNYGTGLESIARLYKRRGSESALMEAVHQAEIALNEHHQEPMNDWVASMIQNAGVFYESPEKYNIQNEIVVTGQSEPAQVADDPVPVSTDTLKLECRRILRDFFVPGGCKELNVDEIFRLRLFFDVVRSQT